MENVAPSGALARRSRQLLQLAFVVVAGGVFIAVVGLALYVVQLAVPDNSIYPFYNFLRGMLLFGGVIVAVVGVIIAARAYFTRVDNDLARQVGIYLERYFDNRYWLVRNVNKTGLGYIDAVLVGPPGLLVFRIVDNEGNFRNEKADWLKQNNNGQWVPARIDPTREDVVDIKAAREYLARHGLEVPVYGVVVFTKNPTLVKISAKEPVVPLSHLSMLYENLRDQYLARENRIDQPTVQRIIDLIYDR
ncbi:MAG: NERD domain-containing protein [Anaerolineae bacterium]|nr:NERD domain-containing protein [Anaerolineae bacterium]